MADWDEPTPEEENERIEQADIAARHRPDERPPNAYEGPGAAGGESHAAGTPGGGTAVGGLAGTNMGEGEPDNADLEAAAGSGNFDAEIEDEDQPPYSGRAGGAVGGSPAEKRAVGGNIDGGIAPQSTGRDSTIGPNPGPNKPR